MEIGAFALDAIGFLSNPVGRDVGLCYSPEFIALGSVIRDMTEPDLILVGESDPMAGDVLEKISRSAVRNSPPAQRMSLVDAEITKIASTYTKLEGSQANAMIRLLETLEDLDDTQNVYSNFDMDEAPVAQ